MKSNLTRNIWAVGRNYIGHAKEMKAEIPTEPFFFLKSGGCIELSSKVVLPMWSNDVHHELEVAFWLDENLQFSHVTLALDLTARDAQSAAKAKGLPWTMAKSFQGACPLGPWIDLTDLKNSNSMTFTLTKNGALVQNGNLENTIFKPTTLLEYAKKHFPVQPYDIILTGTPEGVGPLKNGDLLEAHLYSENREILACNWDVI